MVQIVNVFYEGMGERWHWGTLATAPRKPVYFEYTDEARAKGLQLSPFYLPLERKGTFINAFPDHQLGLPGPVYDALPDGWGMLLMDRLFKKRGLNVHSVTPLDRLAYVGHSAMGALTFEPADVELDQQPDDIPLELLAREAQAVLEDKDSALLKQLALVGGSPHGARPKVLLSIDRESGRASTRPMANGSQWLVKFPAQTEHPEVCAIEDLYTKSAAACGLDTPSSFYMDLGNKLSAFGTERFDRVGGQRIHVHTLAGLTQANYRVPGSMDYSDFLRATWHLTKDARELKKALERAVFNIVFNNRDDHPKNFSYRMDNRGQWTLAPVYDVTYNAGPGGYHQMDVGGEAQVITFQNLLNMCQKLGANIAPTKDMLHQIVERISAQGMTLEAKAQANYSGSIRRRTIADIQGQVEKNIRALQPK